MRITSNFSKAVSTGVIVLLLLSLILFWLRLLCEYNIYANASKFGIASVVVKPSGIMPKEIEDNPVVIVHSSVRVSFNFPSFNTLGLNLLSSWDFGGSDAFFARYTKITKQKNMESLLFDKDNGLIVYNFLQGDRDDKKMISLYAGPDGVSEIPEEKLGKFTSLLFDMTSPWSNLIVYDKTFMRFYKVDFTEKKIIKGQQLAEDDIHKPVQIGSITKNRSIISDFRGNPCLTESAIANLEEGLFPNNRNDGFSWGESIFYGNKYLPVLNASNQIYLLDKETLEFTGTGGYLFAPDSLFETNHKQSPEDLLAYHVLPVYLDNGQNYAGMLTTALNREGTGLELTVFDPNGKIVKAGLSGMAGTDGLSGKAMFFGIPWGPVWTATKYLLENLQPPALLVTSYFTSNSFEAGSGHRALFVLPNSFIAMKGRSSNVNILERVSNCFLLMFPSILLLVILTKRINKDAMSNGLSDNERRLWMIGTILFGLVGYITYKLTKPKLTLVTCQNCGKPRRPDMENCHHCRSKWHIPELIPPTWRILN